MAFGVRVMTTVPPLFAGTSPLAGLIVDVGPVPLMFGVAGAIVVLASLAGFASGVPRQMVYASEAEEAA